jgi:hypothetical protein
MLWQANPSYTGDAPRLFKGKEMLPPKLQYRFNKWRKSLISKPKQPKLGDMKMSEIKKHETQVSFYKSDVVRMDFGSGVDANTKKMALEWAKKKGLNIVDETLAKSANGIHTVIFSKSKSNLFSENKPVKTIVF